MEEDQDRDRVRNRPLQAEIGDIHEERRSMPDMANRLLIDDIELRPDQSFGYRADSFGPNLPMPPPRRLT